jgi:DivIVA domain-containing protein
MPPRSKVMPLPPEEITAQSFRTRWRGYDHAEVDSFLRRVATDYAVAAHRLAALIKDCERSARSRDELAAEFTALAGHARASAEQTLRDAEQDATRIRERGEQAAAAILKQAEQAATAVLRQAHQLRAAAEEDVASARRDVEEARQRREAEFAAADRRRDALRGLEARLAGRLRDTDHALGELRARVDMVGEVHRLEELIATVRSDTWAEWADVDGAARPTAAEHDAAAGAVP